MFSIIVKVIFKSIERLCRSGKCNKNLRQMEFFVLGSLRTKYLTRSQVLRSEDYLYAVIILGGLRKKYLTRCQILLAQKAI